MRQRTRVRQIGDDYQADDHECRRQPKRDEYANEKATHGEAPCSNIPGDEYCGFSLYFRPERPIYGEDY